MKMPILASLLIAALLSPAAFAQDEPVVVIAKKDADLRIRMSDVYRWESDKSDTSMVLTTRRREQFLVEFEGSCFNLRRGPRSNILLTEDNWLDRSSHIRLVDRDMLPMGHAGGMLNDPNLMSLKASGTLCPVKAITALGKKPKTSRADS